MKIKSKTRYLGEINSILPGQMAEQLAVEVDVKNVTDTCIQQYTRTSSFIWFGYEIYTEIFRHAIVVAERLTEMF